MRGNKGGKGRGEDEREEKRGENDLFIILRANQL